MHNLSIDKLGLAFDFVEVFDCCFNLRTHLGNTS
jgi:hypothetical protein